MARSSSKRLNHGPLVLLTNSATPITSREGERESDSTDEVRRGARNKGDEEEEGRQRETDGEVDGVGES